MQKNPVIVVKGCGFLASSSGEKPFNLTNYKKEIISVNHETIPYKLWISEKLLASDTEVSNWKFFLSLIYRYDKIKLVLWGQNILFSDLKVLAEKRNEILNAFVLMECQVIGNDSLDIPMEEIIDLFSGAEIYGL